MTIRDIPVLRCTCTLYGVRSCETFRCGGRFSSLARWRHPSAVRRPHGALDGACGRENPTSIGQAVQEEKRPPTSAHRSVEVDAARVLLHCSPMLLRQLRVAATSRPISTALLPHASVAEGWNVDRAMTSSQPRVRTPCRYAMLLLQRH